MYLKSIELFGFKSFPEKTTIEFNQGITVIVGPNGCGKSNIVDSIKWVLGEKQAKNIRGAKMEDVIFSGTESRKPLSLAEVTISIDNSGRILDFDSDVVTVTRRVFRDGESEYLINKSPVRLKDIDQLFMDTGIGKSAYSVMEQGKIDLILSSSAEDRRYIFEEAAGISKFKMQKRESLKKLEDTGANIERINDVIHEIEREKEAKARQAEKTKTYLALRSELTENDIRFNAIRYHDLLRRRERIQEDLERLKKQREEISAKVSLISSENEKDEKRKNDIQLQLFELDKELHTYRIRIEDIDQRSEKGRARIEEQNARKAAIGKNIAERTASMEALKEESEKAVRSGAEIQKRIADDRERLAAFLETRERKITSIKNARAAIEANRARIKAAEGELEALREELEKVIRRLVDAIDRRKAEVMESEIEREHVRREIHARLDDLEFRVVSALGRLAAGDAAAAATLLEGCEVPSLKSLVGRFESYEDGFRSILIDKGGIHSEKEAIDNSIRSLSAEIEELKNRNTALDELIRSEQKELDDVNMMIGRVEKDLSRNETEREWIERHIDSLKKQIVDVEKQIANYGEDMERCEGVIEACRKEIAEWEKSLVDFGERTESLARNIGELAERRSGIDAEIQSRKNLSRRDMESLNRVVERIGEQDKNMVEANFRIDRVEEYVWTEYEKKAADLKAFDASMLNQAELQKNIQDLKKKIQDLGPINNLAIEEYRDLKKRFEYYINQKKDIEKAREDILSVIEEINRTSVDMFMRTFKSIQKNFSEIFRQLFEGGDAALELVEPENVLETGIEILVRPPGKKLKNINLLSGGERALTAIALLFATYMEKPSPFCFLDEIDAPLDEENIGRFIKMLREFSRKTQFAIVSHNKKTMSTGESIYGITMSEPGVSKVVSLRMEKYERKSG
jgi:chromosome segregation protein